MSIARKNLDWNTQIKLAIDPEKARKYREQNPSAEDDVCTMCGKYCAIKQLREYFNNKKDLRTAKQT